MNDSTRQIKGPVARKGYQVWKLVEPELRASDCEVCNEPLHDRSWALAIWKIKEAKRKGFKTSAMGDYDNDFLGYTCCEVCAKELQRTDGARTDNATR